MRTRGLLCLATAALLAACDGPKNSAAALAQSLPTRGEAVRIAGGGDLDGPRFVSRGVATILTVTGWDSRGFRTVLILDAATLEVGIVSRADTMLDPTTGFWSEPLPDKGSKEGSAGQGGEYAVFLSRATNLVELRRTTPWRRHVYLRDLFGETNELVSVGASPGPGNASKVLVPEDTRQLPEANADTTSAVLSGTGRYVAFTSAASNLVPLAGNGVLQVFLFDRVTRSLEVVSRVGEAHAAYPGDGDSTSLHITGDGRFVVYRSEATNLVADDPNGTGADLFVFDRTTGTTRRVDIGAVTGPGQPVISDDGTIVAFSAGGDVFVCDRRDPPGTQPENLTAGLGGDSETPAISPDGRFVVFRSGAAGIHVHDRQQGVTSPVATSADGESLSPTISPDGRVIAFVSSALDLAPDKSRSIVEQDGRLTTISLPAPPPSQALDLYIFDNPLAD